MERTSPVDAVRRLHDDREAIVRELAQLSDADCRIPAKWRGIDRSVNFLLRTFSLHDLDHLQHLEKLLRARGRHFSEAQSLLARAQALRGELEARLLSLSEEEFDEVGPEEGDWSVRQLVEHLMSSDAKYLRDIRAAMASGRSTVAS